jgi:4-hydroxybenzoate polyprenyltransferase
MLILLKDMRTLRILHYALMLLLGVVIALTNNKTELLEQLHFSDELMINIFLCLVSIFFSCLFSLITNNIADIKIDTISNPERPLISREIEMGNYKVLGNIFLLIAFFYASMVNARAVLLIGVTVATYYLYSMPPLQLKRITLFSKLAISINSMVLVVLGYTLVQDNLSGFPNGLYGLYLIGVTLAANFIDLKDIKGDSALGIMTLPVLIGERQAKALIGAAFWAAYVAFFYLVKNFYILPLLIIGGGVQFYLINRKKYHEKPVLGFYILSIIFFITYLLVAKIMHTDVIKSI